MPFLLYARLRSNRPGSGTTTFLKAIAGLTAGYAGVDGEVIYNTANMAELGAGKKQVLFCSEDDVFYANLKVGSVRLADSFRMY